MKLNKLISGVFFAVALFKFIYREAFGTYSNDYFPIICLALIGILAHMVFERREVSK